ncbi:ABC transporter permease subunit [Sulfidibacter corallicola]|uniref:ABC transporter permease subunit n=1 Tax=Sulfidibacter corallicola TaxID=2818388 RepID=A0A8A4TTD9_SULCO|nr:ABC transporter permease subunit [Sulfidibacter corallicola]QTD52647.1 ABC transporter permease subunit [Sulfidibacter corallicola]
MFEARGVRGALLGASLVAFCAAPFVLMPLLSLAGDWSFPDLAPGTLSPRAWLDFLGGNNPVGRVLLRSSLISLVVAASCTPIGFLAARFVAYDRGRKRWLLLAYAPYAFSPVILGTCLLFLYLRLNLAGTLTGVILAQSMFALAFAIVFFVPFWNRRVLAMEELVYTLGGTRLQAFTRVLLPLSRELLLICFFQCFLISWTQYGLTLLIGAGKVQTLPLMVFEYVNEANPYYAALASSLLILPPALFIVFNRRLVFTRERPAG